jgi:LEA14-like dessication related protein
MYRLFYILIVISLLGSCSTLNLNSMIKPEPPQIKVASLKIVKSDWPKQHFKLKLHVKNTNAFPLSFASMNFQLYLNKKQFTTGKSNPDVTLPAFGEQFLTINIISDLMEIFDSWKDWKQVLKERQLNYKIVGNVTIWKGTPQIPFEHRGQMPIEGF